MQASAAGSANVEEPSPPIPENDQSSDNGLWEYEAGAAGSTNVDERPSSPVADVDQSSDNLTHENYDLPPSSPQTPTRVRVTAQNPAFGVVEGAMRGSQKLGKYVFTISHILLTLIWTTEIRRPNMLRPRMMDRATATKRFHRELNNIIARVRPLPHKISCTEDLLSVNDFHRRRIAGWCLLLNIAARERQPHTIHPLTYGAMRWRIL